MYEHNTAIAQGDVIELNKLKETIEALLVDRDLRDRVAEYNYLHNELDNDKLILQLHMVVREMHTQIHGGAILGGYPVCNLCDADVPVDFH